LIYGSVCSGIEAATVAWEPLGWRPAFFAEIDKFPSRVLAHHYPDVPNAGDFTGIQNGDYAAIDLLVGGTPCQAFSVTGLRAGLDDPRGNLTIEYARLAGRLRPRWLVWENVPGVLSIDGGRTFGTFLGMLGQLGYGVAYRVLDAQHFGVPQRRRRVFVVGHLGDWRRAAAVLFERHSLSGHPAPRREKGQTAPTVPSRRTGGGGLGTDFDCDGGLVASTGDIAHCLNAGGMGRQDYETETLITHALRAEGFDASEDGTGRGTPLVPVARSGDTKDAYIVAMNLRGREGGAMPEMASIRAASGGSSRSYVAGGMAVRRLTPRECTRLQGFPDDYLELTYANAEEAHAAQVLHELWRTVGAFAREGWRPGIAAALLTPQVLLAGVYGGWVSWEMASRCATSRGALPGSQPWPEGFVRTLRIYAERGPSPYRREPFEQLARELTGLVSFLPLEGAQAARHLLLDSELWEAAQKEWPLRYAFATGKAREALNSDGPRYKALGNSMAVPVMRWIGERIAQVDAIPACKRVSIDVTEGSRP